VIELGVFSMIDTKINFYQDSEYLRLYRKVEPVSKSSTITDFKDSKAREEMELAKRKERLAPLAPMSPFGDEH